jgi:hypothetical protein
MGPAFASKKSKQEEADELEQAFLDEEEERIAELKEAGADINETDEEEEERRAIAHYAKKREQSRKYYRLNPDKCKQYNKKRASKTKTPADGSTAEPKEKKLKARLYAKQKYHANKAENALRQKAYRLKYKVAYNRWLAKEKIRVAALTPEQRAAEKAASDAADEESEDGSHDDPKSDGSDDGEETEVDEEKENTQPVTPEVVVAPVVAPAKPSRKRKSEIEALR